MSPWSGVGKYFELVGQPLRCIRIMPDKSTFCFSFCFHLVLYILPWQGSLFYMTAIPGVQNPYRSMLNIWPNCMDGAHSRSHGQAREGVVNTCDYLRLRAHVHPKQHSFETITCNEVTLVLSLKKKPVKGASDPGLGHGWQSLCPRSTTLHFLCSSFSALGSLDLDGTRSGHRPLLELERRYFI